MKNVDIDGLLALNKEQIEIVFRHCRGEKNKNIAKLIDIPESSFYVYMRPVYKLMGVSGWDDLDDEFCLSLVKIIQSPEALKSGWPEAFREKIEALRELMEPPKEGLTATLPPQSTQHQKEPQGSISTSPTPPSDAKSQPSTERELKKHPLPWPLIAIPLLVVCLLFIAAGSFARRWFLSTQATPTLTLTSEEVVLPTATLQATDVVVISTFTQTLSPTNTAFPTFTNLPTDTATPSATATISAAFFDDFENGLNPAWSAPIYGTPVASGGSLVSSELTLLSVGDSSWIDYQIDFDVTMIRDCMHDPSFIGIRASDRDNMLLYEFDMCDSEWNSAINGNWKPIPNTRLGNQGFVDTKVHFTITAKGNQIVLYAGSNRLNSFTDPYNHLSGNIYLRIKPGDVFDNFKVTILN